MRSYSIYPHILTIDNYNYNYSDDDDDNDDDNDKYFYD